MNSDSAIPAAGSRRALAGARYAAAGDVALIALPLAMWLANRSAPLVLGLAAAGFLVSALSGGQGARVAGRLRHLARDPIGVAVIGFLLWSLASLAWSHRPAAGFAMWAELAFPALCGAVLVASDAFRPRAAHWRAAALCLAAAALLMLFELKTGFALRAGLGLEVPMSFAFNRPALTCVLLSIPVAHALWTRPDKRVAHRLLATLAMAPLPVLVSASESEAAKFGLVIAGLAFAAAAVMPRLALWAVAFGFAATMALAPMIGLVADSAIPASVHERAADAHTRDRVDIWLAFGEAARARPVIGSGFGSAATLQDHPVAARVALERRWLLAVGHPHNMPLQAWVETGFVGAACLSAAGLLLLARLSRSPPARRAPMLALFAGAFSVASVAHGAWQGWWIAALAAAVVWFWCGRDAQGNRHA